MSAGMSTFVVLLAWAAPIAIAVAFMAVNYRSPTPEELEQYDKMQPDEVAPTPEALANKT
jgi:hypothetical protein